MNNSNDFEHMLQGKEMQLFTSIPQNHHQVPGPQIVPPTTAETLNNKLQQVCSLLVQLTEEQKQTNVLLRKMLSNETTGGYKLIKLVNQDNSMRILVVLESDKSRPRLDCPICHEDVEITTAKRGGCKQQSFCGDYIVCNECSNDALQKILRCPNCCESYSNIPVPLCKHLTDASVTEGHLARKGSGSGCPVCANKLVKERCPENCSRKDLPDYNQAKTILSDRIFVLVKNPSCTEEVDRPCIHYCRCPIHNILFTNRNKGAKCRECKEGTKPPKITGKRKRARTKSTSTSAVTQQPAQPRPNFPIQPDNHTTTLQSIPPPPLPMGDPHDLTSVQDLEYPLSLDHPINTPRNVSDWNWLNIKELGKKVSFDELIDRIPYEGVIDFGKRVSSSFGFNLNNE